MKTNPTATRWPTSIRLVLAALCLAIAATSAALPSLGGDTNEAAGPPEITEELAASGELTADLDVTEADLAAWEETIATPEGRTEALTNLQEAFADVADVGVDSDAADPVDSSLGDMEPILAYGANWNHVWVTASYADMARGAIRIAVSYCIARRVPSWLCRGVGDRLSGWARGWGAANNHGVWGAVYWAPARITGGRW